MIKLFKTKYFAVLLGVLLLQYKVNALVPVESLVLGDYQERYNQEKLDPLNYIFSTPMSEGSLDHKRQLALYRGTIIEGENLNNYCKTSKRVQYPTVWQRTQAKRSLAASMQFVGLDITVRALAQYAKYFEFTKEDYSNLAGNLVGNYCSENLSIISKKQLLKNMLVRFEGENSFQLPGIKDNKLFSKVLSNINTEDQYRKQEFSLTLDLFKSFCSWGNEADNLRLMVPIIKNPSIYALIIRQLTNKEIVWDEVKNRVSLKDKLDTVQVNCDNLVCRRVDPNNFYKNFPRSVGYQGLRSDLQRLYCKDVKNTEYKYKHQPEKISKVLKSRTLDIDNLLASQFISLVTGIPDFNVWATNYSQGKDFMRASMDRVWSNWAMDQSENFKRDLYYEEPLTLELTDRKFFFDRRDDILKVGFDVNLGEFDRTNQKVGKIKSFFELKISKKFIYWMQKEIFNLDPRIKGSRKKLEDRFVNLISPRVEEVRKKIRIPPWRGDISRIIAKEVMQQISLKYPGIYKLGDKGTLSIPVEFYYGPFALKYIRYQYQVKQNEWRAKERAKDFKRKEIANKN